VTKRRKNDFLIYWHKSRSKWQIHFRWMGKTYHVGTAINKVDARILRNEFIRNALGPQGLNYLWNKKKKRVSSFELPRVDEIQEHEKTGLHIGAVPARKLREGGAQSVLDALQQEDD